MEHIVGKNWRGELYGFCPVQGNGMVGKDDWYFRARGSYWYLEINGEEKANGDYQDAGHIPKEVALSLIRQTLDKFVS